MSPLPFELLVICDEAASQSIGRSVYESVHLLLESKHAGRCAILLRDKDPRLSSAARLRRVHQWAQQLVPLCLDHGALPLVHTFVDVALEFEGCGVHFDSMTERSVIEGFKKANPERCLGQSLHRSDAAHDALDYATMSPVFAPFSKAKDHREALEIAGFLVEQERLQPLPLVALGGVNTERAIALRKEGAQAVAMLSAPMSARSPIELLDGLFAGSTD